MTLLLPYLYGWKCLCCLVPSEFFLLEIDWEYEHRCILTYINLISITLYDRRKYRSQESGVNVSFHGRFSHFVLSKTNNTRGLDRSFVQLLSFKAQLLGVLSSASVSSKSWSSLMTNFLLQKQNLNWFSAIPFIWTNRQLWKLKTCCGLHTHMAKCGKRETYFKNCLKLRLFTARTFYILQNTLS